MSSGYKILYNGTPLVVNPVAFAERSPVFAQYYSPEVSGEMKITSETPVANFEEFLPAVQGGHCAITEENVKSLRILAQQWGVAALIEECDQWSNSPRAILSSLLNAIERKNRPVINDLLDVIAPRLPEFLADERFAQVPPKFVSTILSHARCAATDQHELLRAFIRILDAQPVPRSSGLFNLLEVAELAPDEIELAIMHDRIDLSSIAVFLANCGQMLLKGDQVARDRLDKLDAAIHRLEKQCEDAASDVGDLHKQIDDERRRHEDHKIQLQALTQRYEPGKPAPPPPPPPAKHREEKAPKANHWKGQQAAKSQFVYIPDADRRKAAENPKPDNAPRRPIATVESAKPDEEPRRMPKPRKRYRFTYTPGVDD
jgi:hypothetical protein